jgi:aminoglycoside phosphotransferase
MMFLNQGPLPSHVPDDVADAAGGRVGRRFSGNCSGADVFRITGHDGRTSYLKSMFVSDGDEPHPLRAERDCLSWTASRLAGSEVRLPEVLAFAEADNGAGRWAYLLTSAVPGRPLHEAMQETPLRAARLLGQTLRALHEAAVEDCPAATPLERLLAMAEENVSRGRPSSNRLRQATPRESQKLLKKLRKRPPPADRVVPCHGDYCLPNVVAGLDDTAGLIDLGGLAATDPHLDLACGLRSLRFTGGKPDAERVFLRSYGPDDVDPTRLAWFEMLAELV